MVHNGAPQFLQGKVELIPQLLLALHIACTSINKIIFHIVIKGESIFKCFGNGKSAVCNKCIFEN